MITQYNGSIMSALKDVYPTTTFDDVKFNDSASMLNV